MHEGIRWLSCNPKSCDYFMWQPGFSNFRDKKATTKTRLNTLHKVGIFEPLMETQAPHRNMKRVDVRVLQDYLKASPQERLGSRDTVSNSAACKRPPNL